MRRALWACIGSAILVGVAASSTWAVERELAGIRLGEMAMDLLDKPGYGEPDFIGPLGTVALPIEEPQGALASRAGGAIRSGPAGPTGRAAAGARGMRGGARGMGGGARGMGGGARGMGGGARGMGGGARGMGGGARGMGGGARGMGGGARGMRGGARGTGGTRAGGRGGAGRASIRTAAGTRTELPGMYWYYKRPGNAVVVLSLDPEGEVRAITLVGSVPSPAGITSRGIQLGSDYMEIIRQYGYPDQTVSSGAALELTYVDHGVRFTLDSMRVREVAIGAHIAAAAEAVPAVSEEAAPPPAGMSIEELRGYL